MNNKNNNNSQKIIKISSRKEIPQNYTGIIEWLDIRTKEWYLNGKLHRIDRPAIEWPDGTKEWYLNGKRHRTDGPAVEEVDGSKHWFLNGKLHRTDGPAIERANGYKAWYLNGKYHRTDGPAIELANGHKEWWLNGIWANPLFFEIPDCKKYVDYYMTILQTELREHEEFLLTELKKQVELGIKSKRTKPK